MLQERDKGKHWHNSTRLESTGKFLDMIAINTE